MSNLPVDTWVPIALALLLGVALWAAGSRLVRAAFAAIGFVLGVVAGSVLAETIQLDVSPWIPSIFLGVVLALLANLAYRAAIAGGLALVLGLAAPAAVWIVAAPPEQRAADMQTLGVPEPSAPRTDERAARDEIDEWLSNLGFDDVESVGERVNPDGRQLPDFIDSEAIGKHLERAETLARQVMDRVSAVWTRTPEPVQRRMVGAGLVAALVGFLVGSLAATFSASIVTAATGSVLAMVGTSLAFRQLGDPASAWLPSSPNAWLTWWVILLFIGLAIQFTLRRRRTDKRA